MRENRTFYRLFKYNTKVVSDNIKTYSPKKSLNQYFSFRKR